MSVGLLARQDPAKRSTLLAALYVAQEQHGYLSSEAIDGVAQKLGVDAGEVFETATFYSMYRFEPGGRYVIQVCEGLSCHLAGGADTLAGHLEEALEI